LKRGTRERYAQNLLELRPRLLDPHNVLVRIKLKVGLKLVAPVSDLPDGGAKPLHLLSPVDLARVCAQKLGRDQSVPVSLLNTLRNFFNKKRTKHRTLPYVTRNGRRAPRGMTWHRGASREIARDRVKSREIA